MTIEIRESLKESWKKAENADRIKQQEIQALQKQQEREALEKEKQNEREFELRRLKLVQDQQLAEKRVQQ